MAEHIVMAVLYCHVCQYVHGVSVETADDLKAVMATTVSQRIGLVLHGFVAVPYSGDDLDAVIETIEDIPCESTGVFTVTVGLRTDVDPGNLRFEQVVIDEIAAQFGEVLFDEHSEESYIASYTPRRIEDLALPGDSS